MKGNSAVAALITIALLFVILLFPGHPESFAAVNFSVLPLEWPLIILALLISPVRALGAVRFLLVTVLGLVILLRAADIGSYIAFDRRFSPMVEWHLLGDGWNLASQQSGLIEAGLFIAIAVAILIALAIALFIGLGAIARLQGNVRSVVTAIAATVFLAGTIGLWVQDEQSSSALVQAELVPELIDRSNDIQRSIDDQQAFVAELSNDPLDGREAPGFSALSGLDVAMIFIESYGQSFIFDEHLGRLASERLANIESQLAAANLHVRSGWLTSSVRGGRSWLAHASFASGLAITNQARFDRLISSDRVSLYQLFSDAGWNTAGLVPAIQESWPEGVWYGFDTIYDKYSMGYEGEPFGWVTMPDQYTLSAFEYSVRQASERPVMAEIALISSHAPWTLIPNLVPWDAVGDGSVFDGTQRFGEPMTWNNRSRVREMYAKSLDYSLTTIGEYLELHGKGALFVIHGDHQPASIIAGWGKTADVPVHIVSEDPSILERFPADAFVDGMMPDPDSPSVPMWSMRELMATVFEDNFEVLTDEPIAE